MNNKRETESFWLSKESGTLTSSGKFIKKESSKPSKLSGSSIGADKGQKPPEIKKEEVEKLLDNMFSTSQFFDLYKMAKHFSYVTPEKINPKEQIKMILELYKLSISKIPNLSEEQVLFLNSEFKEKSNSLISSLANFEFHGSVRNEGLKAVIAAYLISLL